MKIILREDLPRWYGLSWRADPPSLILSLHHLALLGLTNLYKKEDEEIQSFLKEFQFNEFDWSFKKGFGFDGAFRLVGDKYGFKIFEAELPEVFQTTDEPCEYCEGTGHDNVRDDKCLYCDGKKKKHIYVDTPAYAISASLNLALRSLSYFQESTEAKDLQLFTVNLCTASEAHGGEFSGMYSVSLAKWLSDRRGSISEMETAMHQAHTHMLKDNYADYDFRASVGKGGWLNVSCPVASFHPSDIGLREGQGYKFSSHNVDSPAKQLTLLAGLAALHDKVDKERLWP